MKASSLAGSNAGAAVAVAIFFDLLGLPFQAGKGDATPQKLIKSKEFKSRDGEHIPKQLILFGKTISQVRG
jgi:hypothetical protein